VQHENADVLLHVKMCESLETGDDTDLRRDSDILGVEGAITKTFIFNVCLK